MHRLSCNMRPTGTSTKTVIQSRSHQVFQPLSVLGIIWPQDTYIGCRKFGWSPPLAALAAFLINVNLSYPTNPSWLPDPFFRIWIKRLYKDKHGSDSMSYDNEGRLVLCALGCCGTTLTVSVQISAAELRGLLCQVR